MKYKMTCGSVFSLCLFLCGALVSLESIAQEPAPSDSTDLTQCLVDSGLSLDLQDAALQIKLKLAALIEKGHSEGEALWALSPEDRHAVIKFDAASCACRNK